MMTTMMMMMMMMMMIIIDHSRKKKGVRLALKASMLGWLIKYARRELLSATVLAKKVNLSLQLLLAEQN